MENLLDSESYAQMNEKYADMLLFTGQLYNSSKIRYITANSVRKVPTSQIVIWLLMKTKALWNSLILREESVFLAA